MLPPIPQSTLLLLLLFTCWGSNPGQEVHHIPNPSKCFKEQRLRNASLRLEKGCPVRAYISGEPCGSRTPCPQPPTATRLCLCLPLSPGQEQGRQMQAAWLYPAPPSCILSAAPPSCPLLSSTPALSRSSPAWPADSMSPAAPRSPSVLWPEEFPCGGGGGCVSPCVPSSSDQS